MASQLSLTSLVVSLAALVLGRLENLPAIAVSAVALGVLEQGVRWNHPSSPGYVYVVFGAVIRVGLVARRPGNRRSDTDRVATWSAAEEVRPVPVELRALPVVRAARWALPALVIGAAASLPNALSPSQQLKAATLAAFAIIALSVVVLTGWAGQVSLGQMSFVGVGGAVGALATAEWHSDLTLALLVAGVAGAGWRWLSVFLPCGSAAYPVSGEGPTASQVSYGNRKIFDAPDAGFPAKPDYIAVDDMAEIWWVPKTRALDEQGVAGTGVVRYGNRGRRYVPGKMPNRADDAFKLEGSVYTYDLFPASDRPPSYPSPRKGG